MRKGEKLEHTSCKHDVNVVEGIVQGASQGAMQEAEQVNAGKTATSAQGASQVNAVQSACALQGAKQTGQVLANENIDEYFMRLALEQAQKAFDLDEVPIGAVVVRNLSSSEVTCKNALEMSAVPSQENASTSQNAPAQKNATELLDVPADQNTVELLNTSVPQNTEIVAAAFNRREIDADPASHAEFLAIELAAKKMKRWRLSDCSVYVTLEPCLMCAGLMYQARIKRCVYGAKDPKAGALGSLYNVHEDTRLNHRFQVESGVLINECSALLKTFFAQLRQKHSLQ